MVWFKDLMVFDAIVIASSITPLTPDAVIASSVITLQPEIIFSARMTRFYIQPVCKICLQPRHHMVLHSHFMSLLQHHYGDG
jgi:hypothetical protein